MTISNFTHVPVEQLEPNPWGTEVAVTMSSQDYELLKFSIATEGIHDPLVVWSRGQRLMVIAGMNRLAIARDLGIATVPAIVREFADEHAAKLHALMDNLARRQLSTAQRAYLAYQFQRLIMVGSGTRTDLQPSSNLTKVDARRTAAELAGVSEGAVSAIKAVVESGNADLLQSVLLGKTPLHVAAKYAKVEAKPLPPPDLTRKPFEPGSNGKPPGGPVFTVIQGKNSDLIANVARFYLRKGEVVCDVTYARGAFWRHMNLSDYKFYGTDIAMEPSTDFRQLPYGDGFADHLVLDPPHVHDTQIPRYNARRTIRDMSHDDIINDLYGGGLKEAWRVLKPGGLAWVKCCDEVVGGHQLWSHIEIYELAKRLGFKAIDLFILHRAAKPFLRPGRQVHARKNHSFLWIFQKPKTLAPEVSMEHSVEQGEELTPCVPTTTTTTLTFAHGSTT